MLRLSLCLMFATCHAYNVGVQILGAPRRAAAAAMAGDGAMTLPGQAVLSHLLYLQARAIRGRAVRRNSAIR